MAQGKTPVWGRERMGLIMIGASLVVIVAAAILLLDYARDTRETRIRAQGISLVRLLSSMPLENLVPESNPSAILHVLHLSEHADDFAYAVVDAADGKPIAEVAADGVLVPKVNVPNQPALWLGQTILPAEPDRAAIIEFHAPLLSAGEFTAYLRLGFFRPGIGLNPAQIPLFATLALMIFMLTPLFYYLVRREIKPLQDVSANLGRVIEGGNLSTIDVAVSGELGQFMDDFNRFVDMANNRINALQSDHDRVIASTRLLSYRKDRILRVLESVPDAILVLDDTGNISIANSKIETVLGAGPDAITGSSSLDWCTQPEVRSFLEQCQTRGTGRALPDPLEFSPEIAPQKTVEVSAYPLFLADGTRTIGSLIIMRDITVETLARNSRAEFVAHVAHELKTPLHVLSMYSEALQDADPEDEEIRVEAANVIYDEVGRLSQLINNMLSITKIEMGSLGIQRQRVRIPELLQDVVDAIRHTRAASELGFETDIPREMSAQHLDKDLLRVALNNLLSNAVKYNRPGGKVRVRAEEDDDVVRISVADDGIGIAENDLPRIFDKFYRSDEEEVVARPGHGLGLSLTREIIELHNGSITATSTAGQGSEFVIELWKYDARIEKAV